MYLYLATLHLEPVNDEETVEMIVTVRYSKIL